MDKKIVSVGTGRYPEHPLGNPVVRNTKEKVKKKHADAKEEPRKADPAAELSIHSLAERADILDTLSSYELIRIKLSTLLASQKDAAEQNDHMLAQRFGGFIEKQKAAIKRSQESGLY